MLFINNQSFLYLKWLLLFLLASTIFIPAYGQSANCQTAKVLTQLTNYCSGTSEYKIADATTGGWFKFTAVRQNVSIDVKGATLQSPNMELATDCTHSSGLSGAITQSGNALNYQKSGLVVGQDYYIHITSADTGSFQLCLNNYNSLIVAGQDCATATFICTQQSFSQVIAAGSGNNPDEARGTCLSLPGEVSESNSVWYKWQASNDGTLVFTITPKKTTDDIDFVLYDLGTTGDCSQVTAANAIRCSAGHGVDNRTCPSEPLYYKVGLDFAATDLTEATGCGSGQDGKLRFLTMQQGHYYALLINNFSSQNNTFTIDFTDQNGTVGTGNFAGPKAGFSIAAQDSCLDTQQFVFTNQSVNTSTQKWTFGSGANISESSSSDPVKVTYSTSGIKTVILEAFDASGCSDVAYQFITVRVKPLKPVPIVNQPKFCLADTIHLSISSPVTGLTYHWVGPDNFTAEGISVSIPITTTAAAGAYRVTASDEYCTSDTGSVSVLRIYDRPIAAFTTTPAIPATLTIPVTVQFNNESANATNYFWDFGDGQTSIARNPAHEYINKGQYSVKLTAFQANLCSISVTEGVLEIVDGLTFIPNTFTPNGDGHNDEFVVTIASLRNYHIQIYNRWGEMVFESKNIGNNWKGTFNGSPLPASVYYYVINAVDVYQHPVVRSGYIALIR
jgi:gliding motility-associated-like protein